MRTLSIALVTIALVVLITACGAADAGLRSGEDVAPTATDPVDVPDVASPVAEDMCNHPGPDLDPALMGTPEISPSISPEPGKPAFTEADVQTYIDSLQSETPITLKRVEFMSACEVATKVNHPVYRPDDTLLALVTLTGDWRPSLPSEVKLEGTPLPGTVAYWIFDATTGNKIGETFGNEGE